MRLHVRSLFVQLRSYSTDLTRKMGRQDPTKVEEIPSLADWYASSAYADWLEDNQEDPRDRREGSQESNGSDQVHDFDEELNKKIAIWYVFKQGRRFESDVL